MGRLGWLFLLFLVAVAVVYTGREFFLDGWFAGKPTPSEASRRDVAWLEAHGFFRFVKPEALDAVRSEALLEGWPYSAEGARRFYFADAETLTENGVGGFLTDLAPVFKEVGCELPELSEEYTELGYRFKAGGREIWIWRDAEFEKERTESSVSTWGLSTARTFALANDLLAASGAQERLYAVGGGNDLSAYLLTPEMADFLSNSTEAHASGSPYIPTEEHPWYGMQPPESSK